jgi:flagellar motor protein MotB
VAPDLGVLAGLSASKRAERAAAQATLDQQHTAAMQQWQQRKATLDAQHAQSINDWQKQLLAHEAKRAAHDREQEWIGRNLRSLLSNNAGFTEKALEDVIRAVDWPLDTLISYDVHRDCTAVDFDLDLPEIEDFPDYRYQLSKDERRLLRKAASETEAAKLYERYIHGTVLRLAGIAFATLPDLRAVTISGYTQRVDPATGQTNDDYVISALIRRGEFSTLNFNAIGTVDPVQALRSFGARSQMRNKRMQPIEPYASGAPA